MSPTSIFSRERRSSVDRDAFAPEGVFEPEQRHPFADVLHDDVRRERRRDDRPRQHLVRHDRGDHVRVAFGIEGLVANASNHEAHLGRALVAEFVRILEAVAHHLPIGNKLFEMGVRKLDTLFLKRELLEVVATGATIAGAAASPLAISRRPVIGLLLIALRNAQRAGQRVELTQFRFELDPKLLLVIRALRLRDKDAALEKLQLYAQSLVRRSQVVALLLQVRDALGGDGIAFG